MWDLCKSDWSDRPTLLFHREMYTHAGQFPIPSLGLKHLPPTERSFIWKLFTKQSSTALPPMHCATTMERILNQGTRNPTDILKGKGSRTKVNGNIPRLPPETCLSSTLSCPISRPFVLKGPKELRKPAKLKFTYFLLRTPGIDRSKGTVNSFLKSTNGPGKSGW